MSGDDQSDLLSGVTDVSLMRFLLEDLHDDLLGKVQRFRYLHDLGEENGRRTMLFGGHVTYNAWIEARSSFVHGNYVATVLLCQSLIENLLAAFLHGGLLNELQPRVQFDETLKRCREAGILTDEDVTNLKALVALRNPGCLVCHHACVSHDGKAAVSARRSSHLPSCQEIGLGA